jgi:UDPglucose 6-dehydrogenase
MKVVIVGAGYVGLVSGACLAARGHNVTCIDINPDVVGSLSAGRAHIYEAGLESLLKAGLADGRFVVSTDLHQALPDCDIVLIAVGTPSVNNEIDLRQVRTVARSIGEYLKTSSRFLSVVVKSTVVPGTTDTVVRQEIRTASGKTEQSCGLGMNPEFLREGCAVEDFMNPDRIVLGHEDDRTLGLLEELYAPWSCEKIAVNSRTAEMIKYAGNAMLATQISAMNEIANLAAVLGGIDMADVLRGVTTDKRWTPTVDGRRVVPDIVSYLAPGCGFGGSCLPKDVRALRSQGMQHGAAMSMLAAVLAVNDAQPGQVAAILKAEPGGVAERRCLVLGAAFKPDTDDVRESASIKIVRDLIASRARVSVHDPIALDNFRSAIGPAAHSVTFVEDWASAVGMSDVIIVATKWQEYRALTALDLAGKIVFDARRMFRPADLKTARYLTIGRRIAQ